MKIPLFACFLTTLTTYLSMPLGAVFLFLSLASTAQNLANKGYQVSQFAAEPYIQVIKRTGKVSFKRRVNLSFKTSGYLMQLNVDEGDTFAAKQLLAALDTAELQADKNATYARLVQAKRNVKRISTLLIKQLSSQRELDDALTTVATTRAAYRVAYYKLEKAQMFAPFSGVVVQRNTELGELQSPTQVALQVAALADNLIVSVALTSEEIAWVQLNQQVQLHLPNFGRIDGVISKIPASANSRSYLFTIEVLLPVTSVDRPLWVGQLAHVLIYTQSPDFVYRLPITALNSVNAQGQALIALEQHHKAILQAFAIYQIDNQYLYITAAQDAQPLSVITLGWNKLALISAEE